MNEIVSRNTNTLVNRTPELIAAEINSIKDQTKNIVLFNSIEIGRRLVEAKAIIPHGEWTEWLEGKVDYSQRTAQNLMKIFEEYGSTQITLLGNNAKSQALANLSYTQAVALLGIPEEERENFIQEHDIENMSTRELQKAIKERDEALKKLENATEAAKKAIDATEKLREEKLKAESEKRLADQVLRSTQSDLKNLQEALMKEKDESKKEITKLMGKIDEINGQISVAQNSGNNEETEKLLDFLEKTVNELNEYKGKVKDLEDQLKAQPIEATVTKIIEKIPEEVEKELSDLRKKAYTERFKVRFDTLVESFNNLLGTLEEIGEADGEIYGKYNNAVKGLINKMQERL